MKRNIETPRQHLGFGENQSGVEQLSVDSLVLNPRGPKKVSEQDVRRATAFVTRYNDHIMPIMIGTGNVVLLGDVFVQAARDAGIKELRVVRQDGLQGEDQNLFSVAASKMLELGTWDGAAMAAALREFEAKIANFSHDLIGFAPGELDKLVGGSASDQADKLPQTAATPVSKVGSLWLACKHRILCGDATDPVTVAGLLDDRAAAVAIVDPPFGCRIGGFVAKKGKHREFVEGSGEKSDPELLSFFDCSCRTLHDAVAPGALVYLFIDWRSLPLLLSAGEEVFGKLINLCVWSKDRAGMGSLYRSQHELVLVFRKPGAAHRNNVNLGKDGRDRSNIWAYPSAASSRKGREGDMLKQHPTPKSVEMIADAILDSTLRGEIVLDTFLGSGTTLIAAERSNRVCYGMDLDPLYVDLAIRRWQAWTGEDATDAETGRSFNEIANSFYAAEGKL